MISTPDMKSKYVKDTLRQQGEAIISLSSTFKEDEFSNAIDMLLDCTGHVVVSGMGKSGLIGQKLSATLASTGTPSFFLHPAEAFHGDLGRITSRDVIILISNSGETDELLKLIPSLKDFGNPIISITNDENSTMAKNSDAVLGMNMDKETCPNNLAPTTSTTLTLAISDAISIALIRCRSFRPEDFAKFHPGGSLGKKLLTRVHTVMKRNRLPLVSMEQTISEILVSISSSSVSGIAIFVDENRKPLGVLTDGDVKRHLVDEGTIAHTKGGEIMTCDPVCISEDAKLNVAAELMRRHKVKSLVVLDSNQCVSGVVDIYDV
ncbi:KpsF/GutQ family sugar-phosphate isomerase [Vibrio mediterranei]|uniref:KpsF/GutQ family sugar-phosphate isomerase n=1 Tax=Vibrio mediterranei TaxID=689 RepID=UPI00406769BD